MCKASVVAKKVTDARKGALYTVGKSSHGLGAFHPAGTPATDSVACVKDDTMLTLSEIPGHLRAQYDLARTEVARFIDTGDNAHDLLEFKNGKQVKLIEFADMDVVALIGVELATSSPIPARRELVDA